MKYIFLLLLAFSIKGQSQNVYEIVLSKNVDDTRMGVWAKGDYKVYVALSFLESSFKNSYMQYSKTATNYKGTDSNTLTFYKHTAKRFQVAAEKIEKATTGFDLGSLIVYLGIDTESENKGNSKMVEREVKQCIENGKAIVLFKGNRVYDLKKRSESRGEGILDHGYEYRIYVDDPENYVFIEYQHLGW